LQFARRRVEEWQKKDNCLLAIIGSPLLSSFRKTLQIKELLTVRADVREMKELKEKRKFRGIGSARNGLPRGIGNEGKGGPGQAGQRQAVAR